MYRNQSEMIPIFLRSNLLHFVSLGILDKDNVLPCIIEPTHEDEFIEYFWLCVRDHRRLERERSLLPEWLIAIVLVLDWNVVRISCGPATDRWQRGQDD